MEALLQAVGEEHRHVVIDQAYPAIAARIIGDLLVDQADGECRPHVKVARVGDAVRGQALAGSRQGAYRWRVGVR